MLKPNVQLGELRRERLWQRMSGWQVLLTIKRVERVG
jgi:hypothetical protein